MASSSSGIVLEGRLVCSGVPHRIRVRDGRVAELEPIKTEALAGLPWIGPGLVDLQINGYAGIDFNSLALTADEVEEAARRLSRQGITTFLPTVITNSDENIARLVSIIAEACESDPDTARSIPGIHLEGPFLSPEDGPRGAHDKRYIREPDWDLMSRWQHAANGRIRVLTLSPEWEGSAAFIRRCREHGIRVSIGHTGASPEAIRGAIEAGATMSTHLGNGAHLMLPRHPNYIWEQLAADEVTAAFIADGFHLPDSVLKVFLRCKGQQAILVSDAVYLAGMPPGTYDTHIGGRVVLTEEGRLHLADQPRLLAGSAQLLPAAIDRLLKRRLVSVGEAWELASSRPASLLGLEDAGRIRVGARADLVVFDAGDDGLTIRQVYREGRLL
ncbi:N-acetylglucosamine-6-phosphate deacetylase [Cohnella fermenti]|uniref:N-acetylglucosamine-6-phosphate deacetylase n=1 Tax=Cohnella fermenti TaxID=2565925 RepID=A0A4S4BIJ2_9BACL|nr:amidohydrolase family protein [Cohnella fermenti]THF73412.1 N-acetylglucosamine-6-phosphate deacetylase [Cohnella fermenti]